MSQKDEKRTAALDESTPLVIATSIADVRRDPAAEAELVTQALMNTPVQAGAISGEWTQITLPDYCGWVRVEELEEPIVKGFCEGDEGVCGVPLPYSAVVIAPHVPLYAREEGEETLGELYLSTVLPFLDGGRAQRIRVSVPGNTDAWIPRSAVEIRPNVELFPLTENKVVIAHAIDFLDVPYLWGGTSWRGIDCSGLVQLCYRMGGVALPRDADQQYAALAEDISREELRVGDLLFFGRDTITHVALALNRYEYIHAEGQYVNKVTINSLDPAHPSYDARLAGLVRGIKRVQAPA